MTDYCSVLVTESWEPDINPNIVVEYVFEDGNSDNFSESLSSRPHSRDHLSPQSSFTQKLQVTQRQNDQSGDDPHCQITLQCKSIHSISIAGVRVVSEARMVELYDAKDGAYLETLRGGKDKEDSEADNGRVHFLCQGQLDRPLGAVTLKFLSLGQRVSFEIAHIRVVLKTCSAETCESSALSQQTINMDRLRQDVHDMGEAVSDRAKAFLTTLENFQKSKHGAVDDMRHLLLDKNVPGGMGQSMMGITALLSTFASSPGMNSTGQPVSSSSTEGSVMNNMLSQMMSSLAMGAEGREKGAAGEAEGDNSDMYQFLQSVCRQVSQQRTEEKAQAVLGGDTAQATDEATGKGAAEVTETSAELESRVAGQVEALMESRLNEVEEHIKQQVDQRMEELETRMTGKLDAIFALLQAQKQF